VANGSVAPFEGDLDDYRRIVLSGGEERGEQRERGDKVGRAEMRRAAAEKRAELAPLQREIKAAEQDVTRLTARIAEIDRTLADEEFYRREMARVAALGKERADAAAALASAEERWLTLSSDYEARMAG